MVVFGKREPKAFVYAWHGLKSLIKEEHNARIHVVAAIVAIVVGCCVDLSPMEWCVILICIGMVVSAEAMNSAVEALADRITGILTLLLARLRIMAQRL